MVRKTPVRHTVRSYTKKNGTTVQSYERGSGYPKQSSRKNKLVGSVTFTEKDGSVVKNYLKNFSKQVSEGDESVVFESPEVSPEEIRAEGIQYTPYGECTYNLTIIRTPTAYKAVVDGYDEINGEAIGPNRYTSGTLMGVLKKSFNPEEW